VGLLAIQQARHVGATVIGVDRFPLRVQAAQALGAQTIGGEAGRTGATARLGSADAEVDDGMVRLSPASCRCGRPS
jgi:threonine dehydrogenase-like Zn-dependent dehydrogenase